MRRRRSGPSRLRRQHERRSAVEKMKKPAASKQLIHDLVAGSRILADHGVLDAYGHISARSDKRPDHFLMSRSRAPALMTKADVMELGSDSEAISDKRKGFIERYI